MTARLTNLLNKRAEAWDAMKAIRERAAEFTELPAEDRAAWDKAESEIEKFSQEIEREERAEGIAKLMEKIDRSHQDLTLPVDGAIPDQRSKAAAEYREVWDEWARRGTGELSADQRKLLRTGFVGGGKDSEFRAMGVATGGAGGYSVPQGFRDVIIETMKYYNAVRQVASQFTTSTGNPLPWPTNNDTGNMGAILGENVQLTEVDLALGTQSLGAYMYTSNLVLLSWQLLQDSAIDLETFLARKLGQRIGRIQNRHFTVGTGTAQPLGLITGGVARQAATGNTTAITYNELINQVFAIDPAYRNSPTVKWMWSDTALASIRKLVDGQNRPLWEPSVQAGLPSTLLGYGLLINNDLAVPAANALSGAFGDFEAGYVIRDVEGAQTVRLDERYADFLQVGWFGFHRTDATVQDTGAYRVFQQSAT